MTWHKRPELKVASAPIKRAKVHIREIMRKGRGRSLRRVIVELAPYLRGWVTYFHLSTVKRAFEELDEWLRRKLRCILWRQWKKPCTRARKLMERGILKARAFTSAYNGRGPWWNAGASHMNLAISVKWLAQQGLVSLLDEQRRLHNLT